MPPAQLPRGEEFSSYAEFKRLLVEHYLDDIVRGLHQEADALTAPAAKPMSLDLVDDPFASWTRNARTIMLCGILARRSSARDFLRTSHPDPHEIEMKSIPIISRRTVLHGFGRHHRPPLRSRSCRGRPRRREGQQRSRAARLLLHPWRHQPLQLVPEGYRSRLHDCAVPRAARTPPRPLFRASPTCRTSKGRISGHKHPYNFLTGHNIAITPGVLSNTVSFDQVAAKHIGRPDLPFARALVDLRRRRRHAFAQLARRRHPRHQRLPSGIREPVPASGSLRS